MVKNEGSVFKGSAVPGAQTVLVLVHGMGAHSGRWEACGEFFANKGIASAAINLRRPGDPFNTAVEDIFALQRQLRGAYPGARFILIGESMGALIACQAAAAGPSLFSGLVCLAPAFKVKVPVSLGMKAAVRLATIFSPAKMFNLPFSPAMLTRDIAYQERMASDQREQRQVSAGLLDGFLKAQSWARRHLGSLSLPMLFVLAGSDTVVSNAATRALFKKISYQDKKLIEHPHMFHALSIDMGKEKVFADILSWIKTHGLHTRD